jgi:hypothetical protein
MSKTRNFEYLSLGLDLCRWHRFSLPSSIASIDFGANDTSLKFPGQPRMQGATGGMKNNYLLVDVNGALLRI